MPTDRDTTPTARLVTVAEAAAMLGITPDAVRARLRRGSLAGQMVNGSWRVMVDGDRDTDTTPTGATDTTATGRDTTRHDAATAAYVAHLEREIDYLREQLAASIATNRRHAEGEAVRGIAAGASVLEVAAAVAPPSTGTDLVPAGTKSPWWKRWLGKSS